MGLDGVPSEELSGKNTRPGAGCDFTGISPCRHSTIRTMPRSTTIPRHTATSTAISSTLAPRSGSRVSGSSVTSPGAGDTVLGPRLHGVSSETQPGGIEHHRHPTTLRHCLRKTWNQCQGKWQKEGKMV